MSFAYHSISVKDTLGKLNAKEGGLDKKEVQKRLKQYGENKLPREKVLSRFSIFLSQFKSPLVYILLFAGIVSGVLGEDVDMMIIFAAIIINVIIGFLQEDKANKALSQLKKMIERHARVLRDGKEQDINADELVPGDIVIVDEGNSIPADGRLIKITDLEVSEASLTGESLPIKKQLDAMSENTVLAERKNMVYMGTLVTSGRGYFVVTATGEKSHFGEIASLVKETKEDTTPLQARISRFSKILGAFILIITFLLFIVGISLGREVIEMFLTSVAVAVASIPEGLPISITIILAIGMQRMSKKNALTRKMAAAETLGSVSVICTDKTGTLTIGDMRAEHMVSFCGELLEGDLKKPKKECNKIIDMAMQVSFLCNNAVISNQKDKQKDWMVLGDSTERALLLEAYELGVDQKKLEKKFPRIHEIPFNSERKFMATLHEEKTGKNIIMAKGAPEIILKRCNKILKYKSADKFESNIKIKIEKELKEMTSKGLRVIALAYKEGINKNKIQEKDATDMVFVGLIGLKDPLRKTAKETIELTKAAGVRPVIVTGDHILTAKAIGKEIGLRTGKENILEGKDIDKLTDAELKDRVKDIDIFARVLPKHKLRIVDAWQKNGEVVAMTGDGVNDAPAIKSADIGIALGSGSDVTKETSDMVLLDDNFKTIVGAVRSGRTVFDNIRKVILYLLSDSFSEVILVAGSLVMGLPLPVTAAQILWVNIIDDSFPGLSLAFDKAEKDIMERKPRSRKIAILNTEMKSIIFIVGIFTSFFLLGIFYFVWSITKDLNYSRTIAFIGLGIDSLFVVYACRSLRHSIWHTRFWDNKLLNLSVLTGIVMLFMVVHVPFLQDSFKTVALGIQEWFFLLGIGMFNLIMIELAKWFFIHRHKVD